MALAGVVRGVAGALGEIFPTGDLLKLTLDDGSVVAGFRSGETGARSTVTVVYSDPGAYPGSSALVMAEGGAGERLEGLSEKFQDRAPLTSVLAKVGLPALHLLGRRPHARCSPACRFGSVMHARMHACKAPIRQHAKPRPTARRPEPHPCKPQPHYTHRSATRWV